jgi:hypothetical protein
VEVFAERTRRRRSRRNEWISRDDRARGGPDIWNPRQIFTSTESVPVAGSLSAIQTVKSRGSTRRTTGPARTGGSVIGIVTQVVLRDSHASVTNRHRRAQS